jgi:hypothetical protein
VRFQVLRAASMKMAPCSLVEVYRHFRGACCLHHQGDDVGDISVPHDGLSSKILRRGDHLDDGGSKHL